MGLITSSTRSREESRKILSSQVSSTSSLSSTLSSRWKREEVEKTVWREWRVEGGGGRDGGRELCKIGGQIGDERESRQASGNRRKGRLVTGERQPTNKSGTSGNVDKSDAGNRGKRERLSITRRKKVEETAGNGISRGRGRRAGKIGDCNDDPLEFHWTESETTTRREMRISFDRRDLSGPLARTVDSVSRQDNWPPLPSACPVGPCFYQDISVDIPLEFQKIVRMLYYLWMFHALMLLLNILGGLGVFVAFGDGSTFGLAILYFFIFTPFSYICWFRPIYKAFRNDSSFNFMVFFFVFSFQLIVSVINAIGVPSMGTCGWVMVGKAFQNSYIGLGIFLSLIALSASALAAAMGVLILWVHRIYRSTGASFAKAQAEFSQGVMGNEHVQNVASNAASHAVRNHLFTGGVGGGAGGGVGGAGTGGAGGGTGPRF